MSLLFGVTLHVHTRAYIHGERGTPVVLALKVTGWIQIDL